MNLSVFLETICAPEGDWEAFAPNPIEECTVNSLIDLTRLKYCIRVFFRPTMTKSNQRYQTAKLH